MSHNEKLDMGTKVEVKTIPLHGLFIHRKQVWRSLGKLRAESHSTTAQKVFMNELDTEVSTENADFIDGLKVTFILPLKKMVYKVP